MSSASSAAFPSPTGNTCNSVTYDIPIGDIACAISNFGAAASNNTDILKKCCGSAPVTQYNNNCAAYCIAAGKTAGDLSGCFQAEGANPASIFCNGNTTATATGKPSNTASSPSSSSSGNTATGSAAAKKGAGSSFHGQQSISKSGLGLAVMVFLSAAAGTLL